MSGMSSPSGTTRPRLEELEEQVCRLLATDDLDRLRRQLADQHPADVADQLACLDEDEQPRVFRRLASEQAAEVVDDGRLVGLITLTGGVRHPQHEWERLLVRT